MLLLQAMKFRKLEKKKDFAGVLKPGGGEKLPKFHAFVQEQNLRGLCPSVSKPTYKFVFSPKKKF